MIKIFHLTFILLSISSFIGRVYLAEKRPELLEQKWIKVGPHHRLYPGFSRFMVVSRVRLDYRQTNRLGGLRRSGYCCYQEPRRVALESLCRRACLFRLYRNRRG